MRQLTISKSITNRETESVNKYLSEISKLSMVTTEEETRLAQCIRQGDQKALDTLTKANLRFVVSVAKQYQYKGLSLPDLINEGNVGLIKAAKRFDETKGFKFISYAVWWIRQSIIQALIEQSRIVRMPGNRLTMGMRIQKVFSQLEQEHERAPSTEELAEEMNISAEEVVSLKNYEFHHTSLDAPFGDDNMGCLSDFLEAGEHYEANVEVDHYQSLKMEIKRCLQSFDQRQNDIICSFFGLGDDPMTLDEICEKYQLTKERIRQIKDRGINQIRNSKKSNLLKAFLGA